MVTDKKTHSGFKHAGESGLLNTLIKAFPPLTKANERLSDLAVEINSDPADQDDLAFLAREFVQCTLPHKNPGAVPAWGRCNGKFSLGITPGWDFNAQKTMGFPYGSIPRLLLFFINTEAVRTGCRRIEFAASYSEFLRDIGLNPSTGGGKRGDAVRVREQTRRLFSAQISFQQHTSDGGRLGERIENMVVASVAQVWWDPKRPDQLGLWDSWVELGERFFASIIAFPVPVDSRALRALKQSPLALDLYAWATHKAYAVSRKGKPQFVPWRGLQTQFGADYKDPKDFKKKAQYALKKIGTVYRGLRLQEGNGGLYVLPSSRPAILPAGSRLTLFD